MTKPVYTVKSVEEGYTVAAMIRDWYRKGNAFGVRQADGSIQWVAPDDVVIRWSED